LKIFLDFITKICYFIYMVQYAEDNDDSYEDMVDKQVIAEYEAKEKNGGVKFVDFNEITGMLQN